MEISPIPGFIDEAAGENRDLAFTDEIPLIPLVVDLPPLSRFDNVAQPISAMPQDDDDLNNNRSQLNDGDHQSGRTNP